MSVGATLAAAGIGLAALGWLTVTDPKRRRAFGRAPAARPAPKATWLLVLLSCVLASFWSGPPGFVLWLGATSAVGWAMIALPPNRGLEAVPSWVDHHFGRAIESTRRGIATLRERLGPWRQWLPRRRPDPERSAIARSLEARVAALETELATLRAELGQRRDEPDAVLLDLAGHRRQAIER